KTLKRGAPLEAAQEVFRGKETDVGVTPYALFDPQSGRRVVVLNRAISFFESETYALTPAGVVKLPLPLKATVRGLIGGGLVFTIEQAWPPAAGGTTWPQGALLVEDLDELERGGSSSVRVLMAPGPRESIEQVATSKDRILVAAYENVKGRALIFSRGPDGQ